MPIFLSGGHIITNPKHIFRPNGGDYSVVCENFCNLISDLKQSQKIGTKIVVFCGAGISIDSGLPGVKQIKTLIKQGQLNLDKFNDSPNRKMIFWRTLMSHYSYNSNHYYTLLMADNNIFDTIITSNYDCLLEQCVSDQFPDWDRVNFHSNNGIEKIYSNGIRIVKIHGDIYQKNVDKIRLLTLTKGNKVKGNDRVWNSIFNTQKKLWVIGYSGKKGDAAYKNIKKSLDENLIEKVYWMYLENEKDPQGEVLPEHSDKLHFIPIKGSKETFKKIIDSFLIPQAPEDQFNREIADSTEKVRESVNVANITIELLEKLDNKIVTDLEKAEENFDDLLEPGPSLENLSKLFVLRRFNSYTPVLRKNVGRKKIDSKGGGYFVTHKGFGIVIDPGYDFIENFLNCNYIGNKKLRINHIDAVIITHAHNDHYGELDSLQNIIYQFNNRVEMRIALTALVKRVLQICKALVPADDKKYLIGLIRTTVKDRPHFKIAQYAIEYLEGSILFDPKKLNALLKFVEKGKYDIKKNMQLLVSRSAYKSVDGLIPIKRSCFENVYILNPKDSCIIGDIEVKATQAKHSDLYSDRHAIGLKLILKVNGTSMTVGFTGDTGYFSGIEEKFYDCDVLIPHLGSIKPKELEIYKKDSLKNSTNTTATYKVIDRTIFF